MALTCFDEQFLHLIEAGTEREFLDFKTTKLEMPIQLASNPWFRKDNAYQWVFVRDAYREFQAEQLLKTAAYQTTREINADIALLTPTAATPSTTPGASESAPVSTAPKRKRLGNAKSIPARMKRPCLAHEVIDLSSPEQSDQDNDSSSDHPSAMSHASSPADEEEEDKSIHSDLDESQEAEHEQENLN